MGINHNLRVNAVTIIISFIAIVWTVHVNKLFIAQWWFGLAFLTCVSSGKATVKCCSLVDLSTSFFCLSEKEVR